MQISELQLPEQPFFPYVTVFDGALPRAFCERMIGKFEANEGDVQRQTYLRGVRNFTEINVSENWHDEHEIMVRCIQSATAAYVAYHGIIYDAQIPRQFGYEQFRMKRYLPNGIDVFNQHADVGNYGSARRFVAFQWYLNTVKEGGETGFGRKADEAVLKIPAVEGRLLVFPPLWTHLHWGSKVVSGPKYILTGYLHYI
jgi:hypothetical protein